MCLSEGERKGLTDAWVAAGKKYGVRIMDHIGAQSITEAKALAAHAAAAGCVAICAMAPQFFKPATPRVLALWLKEIGAAAPTLPLYYYNFPVITGVDLNPMHLIQEIEAVGVPTFRGMKFTDFNLWWFSNCLRHGGGKYDIAYGRDEAMLGGLALGAKGSIGNGFNFAPGVYHRIRAAFKRGDLEAARAEQARANLTVDILSRAAYGGNGLATCRAMYELKGKVALGPPRMPIAPLSAAQRAALKDELTAVGFFEWSE